MIRLLIIVVLLVMLENATPDHAIAYSCDDVRNAVRTMTKEQLDDIRKQMTPEQLAAAKRCLKGNG